MRVIRVEGGLVVGVEQTGTKTLAEWAALFVSTWEWVQHDTADVGWLWDEQTQTATPPPPPSAAEVKAKLSKTLQALGNLKRDAAAATKYPEHRMAQVVRAFGILIAAYQGLAASAGYNPVADGVISADDRDFMLAVKAKADQIGAILEAQDAIQGDIDDGTISDPSTDLSADQRWPA